MAGEKTVQKEATIEKRITVESKTPHTDKYQGVYIIKSCKESWLKQINPKHDGLYIFEGAFNYLSPERDKDTGLVKTGLTDEEARELEAVMGLKLMELSPYSTFWANFKIYARIDKSGLKLDLTRSALDKIKYCYLKVHSKVALSSIEALDEPRKEYVMTSVDIEAKIDSKKMRIKVDAVKRLTEMTLEDQIEFLQVFEEGRNKVSKSATADFIFSRIGDIVDTKPDKFLELVNNPDYKSLLFLQQCLSIGAIRKSGTNYFIAGGESIGKSQMDTVQNLQKPEYNEVKISLKAKIDASK